MAENTSTPVANSTPVTAQATATNGSTASGSVTNPGSASAPAASTSAPAKVEAAAEKLDATQVKTAPGEAKQFTVKIDGQDVVVGEQDLIRLAQQGGAAQKRFQEAATMRKQAEQVLEFVKTNPAEALKRLGIDVRKFSEETLLEHLKREQETPEQKKARELEEKVRTYEAKEKEAEEAAKRKAAEDAAAKEQKARADKEAALVKRYDEMFTQALEKADVPKNAWSVARMATLARIALKQGHEIKDGAELAEIVRQDYEGEQKARIPKTEKGEVDGEKLLSMLGEEVEKAIRKAFVKKLKGAPPKFSTPVDVPVNNNPVSKPGSWREFANRNRRART